MKNGYYLMSRGWMDNPALSNPSPYDRRSAWVWIIEKACYRDTKQDVLGKTTIVVRTSLVTSVRYLAQHWGWREKAVRTFLKRLEKEEMIRTETGLGKTQIFVINYDSYQLSGQASDTVGANEGQQKKKVKENKENIYISKDDYVSKMKSLYYKRECEKLDIVATSFVKMASTFANGKYRDYLDASDASDCGVEEWSAF